MQSFPSLQSAYPSRDAGRYYSLPQQGNTAYINAVPTTVTEERMETQGDEGKEKEKKERIQAALDYDLFAN